MLHTPAARGRLKLRGVKQTSIARVISGDGRSVGPANKAAARNGLINNANASAVTRGYPPRKPEVRQSARAALTARLTSVTRGFPLRGTDAAGGRSWRERDDLRMKGWKFEPSRVKLRAISIRCDRESRVASRVYREPAGSSDTSGGGTCRSGGARPRLENICFPKVCGSDWNSSALPRSELSNSRVASNFSHFNNANYSGATLERRLKNGVTSNGRKMS